MFASKIARAQRKAAETPPSTLAPPRSRLPSRREMVAGRCGGSPPAAGGRGAHDFGAISVERKNGVVHGPAGAANRFDDCPAQWRTKANAAQTLGSSWLGNVVNGLNALPKPIPAPVANLLTKHFHTTFDKDIAKIAGRYRQLETAIKKSIDFQCETSCDPDVLGYVYSIWSDLHLCPYWFNSGAELQASTVIHELAHDVVGCDDNAYEWQTAKYRGMSVNEAINNADSYAHFAWDASKP
jgi:lysine-specific metallo-endopeptidase family protein